MNDKKDDKTPGDDEERTIFAPGAGGGAPVPPANGEGDRPPADGDGAGTDSDDARRADLSDPDPAPVAEPSGEETTAPEEPKTVFAPGAAPIPPQGGDDPQEPGGAAGTGSEGPAEPPPAEPEPELTASNIVPREAARPIQVGDVLNHIFEVKRFIARGGMGEVFEGCNVNTDERVAIKVMLPAMAADEKIIGLFRKEARTLTRLQHEALVSYRVLAQEPQLGVLYIVTEYVEGVELSDELGKVAQTPDEMTGLLRRLASGLAHAHRIGAIHRDLSPDNVLLPGGDVHEATIIDFGIAKDLNAGTATIVGDGFAGKLNYVAPEQLGDFGREIGPWTDVYSLGLVILAVALGKPANMSGSLVDAIDKRRAGPDLSGVPRTLRPLLEDMLKPDPKDRLRSMDEVLARLGGGATVPPTAPPPPPPGPDGTGALAAAPRSGAAKPLLIGGGVVVAALIAAAGAWYAFGDRGGEAPVNTVVTENKVAEPTGDPVADARRAINTVLPSVGCTWLDISNIERGGGGVRVAMRGVAGDEGAARREISQALSGVGIANAQIDFGDVAQILPAGCAALDTYRQVRSPAATHVSVPQPRFETMLQPPGMPYAGEQAANAVIDFNLANLDSGFTILGIEPSGLITTLIPDREAFETVLAQSQGGQPLSDEGGGRYRLHVDLNHLGWSGIILIRGQPPFEPDLVAPPLGSRGPQWQQRFVSAAARQGWRVEMVWFESVDRRSGDLLTPPGGAAAGSQSGKP